MHLLTYFLVIAITSSYCMNAMELLPYEIITKIIICPEENEYSWETFKRIKDSRTVCTLWKKLIPASRKIQLVLDVPDIHYKAMVNDAQGIIDLKLNGHSQWSPDRYFLYPADYALGMNAHEALKILHLASGVLFIEVMHKQKISSAHKETQELIALLRKPQLYDTESKLITNAIQKNYFEETITIMSTHSSEWHNEIEQKVTQLQAISKNFGQIYPYFMSAEWESTLAHRISKNAPLLDEIVRMCIIHSANVNIELSNSMTPLIFLMHTENADANLAQLLTIPTLDINKKQNFDGNTAAHFAASLNRHSYLEQLLKTNKCNINTVNKKNVTPLKTALSADAKECIELLLNYYAKHQISLENSALMHFTLYANKPLALKTLIKKTNLSLNGQDKKGNTPLIIATKKNYRGCVEVLLKYNALIDIKNNKGETAVHWAANKNRTEFLKTFIELGASINNQCGKNRKHCRLYTPLHFAARHGHLKATRILLENGADIFIKTANDETADLIAEKAGHKGVALYLYITKEEKLISLLNLDK